MAALPACAASIPKCPVFGSWEVSVLPSLTLRLRGSKRCQGSLGKVCSSGAPGRLCWAQLSPIAAPLNDPLAHPDLELWHKLCSKSRPFPAAHTGHLLGQFLPGAML